MTVELFAGSNKIILRIFRLSLKLIASSYLAYEVASLSFPTITSDNYVLSALKEFQISFDFCGHADIHDA